MPNGETEIRREPQAAAALRRSGHSISLRAMSFHRFILPLLCLALAGCRPGVMGQGDEQKDPYFLAGKNRLQERNYQGAIDMFEKALDVNPRSASAHFELGILYEQQQGDYAAALYHYQKAVTLRPDLLSADLARQRIQECKRELAKSVIQPLSAQNLQRDIETLRAENQLLKQQLQVWQNFYAGRSAAPSNFMQAPVNPSPRIAPAVTTTQNEVSPPVAPRAEPVLRASLPSSTTRTHIVVAGENPAGIARKYNLKLSALQTANPSMDSKRLRPGQLLVIPSP
jgi:tetratricopeptide (TPR) repeat protein